MILDVTPLEKAIDSLKRGIVRSIAFRETRNYGTL